MDDEDDSLTTQFGTGIKDDTGETDLLASPPQFTPIQAESIKASIRKTGYEHSCVKFS